MPKGKPAGIPCIQLSKDNLCMLFGNSERPAVCSALCASEEMCRSNDKEAYDYLATLEAITAPTNNFST
jgi:hypothetical protein